MAHRIVICRGRYLRIVKVRDVVRAVLLDRDRGLLLVWGDDAAGHPAWALLGGEVEGGEDDTMALS
jgi:ADP-ribose pyrophosphatase YjhB (NUDIX family)